MQQIFHGVAVRILFQRFRVHVLGITVEHDFTTQSSCIRSHVDEVVCGPHDLLVVLHDDHRVAQRLQFFQYVDQTVRIATVQSDAGLVEDIQ